MSVITLHFVFKAGHGKVKTHTQTHRLCPQLRALERALDTGSQEPNLGPLHRWQGPKHVSHPVDHKIRSSAATSNPGGQISDMGVSSSKTLVPNFTQSMHSINIRHLDFFDLMHTSLN